MTEEIIKKTIEITGITLDDGLCDFAKRGDSKVKAAQDALMYVLFKKNVTPYDIATLMKAEVDDVLCALFRVGLKTGSSRIDHEFYRITKKIMEIGRENVFYG